MSSTESVDVPLHTPNRLQDLFNQVDRDNDGRVTYLELWQFLRYNRHGIPKNKVRKIHEKADRNDDETLCYEEFKHFVLDPETKIFDKYFNNYMKVLLPQKHQLAIKSRGLDTIDGAYEERYSCWPPKLCMIIISLVIIIFYIIDAAKAESNRFGPISWGLIYNPRRRKEVWRFLTYMFVHIGINHLLMNIIVQIFLGLPLEMVHKWWRILIVYLFGVLAGSLGSSIVDSHSYLAGASGGVYALMTAHIASVVINWKEMRYPLPQLLIFLILITADVGSSIYNRYVHEGASISYAAHFFGGLGGLLMGTIILDNIKVRNHEKIIKYVSICLISLLISVAVVYNAMAESHFPKQDV
nr:rhomboid-related protein 2-like [Onthophagus taurus]